MNPVTSKVNTEDAFYRQSEVKRDCGLTTAYCSANFGELAVDEIRLSNIQIFDSRSFHCKANCLKKIVGNVCFEFVKVLKNL